MAMTTLQIAHELNTPGSPLDLLRREAVSLMSVSDDGGDAPWVQVTEGLRTGRYSSTLTAAEIARQAQAELDAEAARWAEGRPDSESAETQTYRWRTDAAAGTVTAESLDAAVEALVADGEWPRIDSRAEDGLMRDGAWLLVVSEDGQRYTRGVVP